MTPTSDPSVSPKAKARSKRQRRRSDARPEFLEGFPEHEGLSQAVAAFENGNYAQVRKLCQQLLDRENDHEVRRAATELLRRIEPDRMIVAILWASFLLLALVVLWVYGRGR
jgi:hypothetical protein